ncbi:hypothetical protein KY363_01325 [Candidatus Woesearchaeota archaeon]|nr:hypothetical protein [Candidatus Woesearchaeota archaeon]
MKHKRKGNNSRNSRIPASYAHRQDNRIAELLRKYRHIQEGEVRPSSDLVLHY